MAVRLVQVPAVEVFKLAAVHDIGGRRTVVRMTVRRPGRVDEGDVSGIQIVHSSPVQVLGIRIFAGIQRGVPLILDLVKERFGLALRERLAVKPRNGDRAFERALGIAGVGGI